MTLFKPVSVLLAATALPAAWCRTEVAASAAALLRLNATLAQDSECSDTPSVSEDACLGKSKCMFLELDKRNLCVPCEWGGAPVPCVPSGAAYPQGMVKSCSMSCEHQQVVSKVSDCTDVSGDINQEDCYSKGSSAGISCMWTAYTRSDGSRRTMCGPCKVDGYGVVGRSAPGTLGPEPGSLIEASFSQCEDHKTGADKPCFDPSGCPTAMPPMPPQEGDKPVVMTNFERLGLNTTLDAPKYFGAPVPPPYGKEEFTAAAKAAAKAAGWETPVTEVNNVDTAFVEPDAGPIVPPGISQKPVQPLPGLLYPVPAFKPSPGPGILAEPGNSFTPKIEWPEEVLLQSKEASSGRKRRLRRQTP
eukprot:gb/GFBE01051898.1/.p1 GENE.gb/GFBE01051898.1/~~gb/GFBE01051898.1/.p1  ORF type:complete len:360 (+),score=85.23 gb/GFBE01051898.1/:1-1080(+)